MKLLKPHLLPAVFLALAACSDPTAGEDTGIVGTYVLTGLSGKPLPASFTFQDGNPEQLYLMGGTAAFRADSTVYMIIQLETRSPEGRTSWADTVRSHFTGPDKNNAIYVKQRPAMSGRMDGRELHLGYQPPIWRFPVLPLLNFERTR